MIREISAAKSRFIAKSAMSFAQFIGTAGLATRLFGEFTPAWKANLVCAMIALVTLAVWMFPNNVTGGGSEA